VVPGPGPGYGAASYISLYDDEMLRSRLTFSKLRAVHGHALRRVRGRPSSSAAPAAAELSLGVAIPTGALAGSLGALCGVGGGLVIIPVLKQCTKMSVHQITATSLFSITIASSVGAASYISQGTAHVPKAMLISTTAFFTAGLGAKVSANMPAATLTKILAVTMLLAVPAVLLKPTREGAIGNGNGDSNSDSNCQRDGGTTSCATDIALGMQPRDFRFYLGPGAPTTLDAISPWLAENYSFLFLGTIVGFSSALLGIGGGIVMTSVMSTMYDMSQHEAVATSLVAMVPTGLSATLHQRSKVHGRAAVFIGGSCALAMAGATQFIAPHVSEADMRKIFAAVLAVSSARMLL
jgi:uncharacterized membrane protein YfcA